MKTSRYTEAQIIAILRQAEGGVPVAELCREHGMSNASFYKWRAKYSGMDASMVSQMKAMEEENRRLKRMYADLSMQNDLLKEALEKSRSAISALGDGRNGGGTTGRQHCAGVLGLRGKRDLLSVQPKAEGRERGDRRSADRADRRAQDMGFWPVFPASAERQRSPVEPQTRLSDLLRCWRGGCEGQMFRSSSYRIFKTSWMQCGTS